MENNAEKSIEILQIFVGGYDNFVYLIVDKTNNNALIVDPAWQADFIKSVIAEKKLNLIGILLTHSHFDHRNADEVFHNKNIPLYIAEAEIPYWDDCPRNAIALHDQDEIAFGNNKIKCHLTPGHTKGSICYEIASNLITGDTLFINGCGRTDLPGGDTAEMFETLQKIKKMSPDLMLFTGHSYGDVPYEKLGSQIKRNPYLLIEDKAKFLEFRG